MAGTTDLYTIHAPYQNPVKPSLVAYSRKCTMSTPFLAAAASTGVGVRWAFDPSIQRLEAVDRACKVRYKLFRVGAGNATSCKGVPGQHPLVLVPLNTTLQGKRVQWDAQKYAVYPVLLEGAIMWGTDGRPLYFPQLVGSFGWSVAIDGDTVLASQTPGAYVFNKDSKGNWQRKLLPLPPEIPNSVSYYEWNTAVALSGNLAVVGVPRVYSDSQDKEVWPAKLLLYDLTDLNVPPLVLPRPGEAFSTFWSFQVSETLLAVTDNKLIYFYGRTPGKPQEISLTPQSTLAGASFLLSGSTLAVLGAGPRGRSTIMYDYNASSSSWIQRTTLNIPGPVALYNDTIVFASTSRAKPRNKTTTFAYLKAFIFQRDAEGNWTRVQEIVEGVFTNTSFTGLALDSKTLVLGIRSETRPSNVVRPYGVYMDREYVYSRIPGPIAWWNRSAIIRWRNPYGSFQGGLKAVSGDIIAVREAYTIKGDNPELQGRVQLWSKAREVAADAGSS